MAKTKKQATKSAPKAAKTAPKVSSLKPTATVKVVKVEKEIAAAKSVRATQRERLEIPAPDFQEWWDNLKAYAHKSPAGLVVGVIAVWMALVLLFG